MKFEISLALGIRISFKTDQSFLRQEKKEEHKEEQESSTSSAAKWKDLINVHEREIID